MTSQKVNKRISSVMGRPHQKGGSETEESNNNSQIQEVLLAFTLTGLNHSDFFSPFFPLHRTIAARLIDYFISLDSVDKLLEVCSYGRDNINPNLFNYAFSVAVLNRKDTTNVLLLSPAETFPDKFFPAEIFQHAIEELAVVPDGSRRPISIDVQKTATDKYVESRLEYFRHDLGLNVCYYFWHLTHPFEAVKKELVNLDRRGEVWYYFHQQIVARYNAERYSNGLLSVVPLSNFDEPIEEGYFPKICTQFMQHSWAPRFDNSRLHDLHRPYEGLCVNKTKFRRWIGRICDAIELGKVIDEKFNTISLNNDKGVDHLGNILQSSILSPNRIYYGDICNIGHAFIAYCHDPENLALQSYSVMGEPSTCARDVLFYRWYAFLVRIMQNHKCLLPTYTKEELGFDGVKISSLVIESIKSGKQNQINTSWDESDCNLKNGLNFQPDVDIYARIKHLQHEEFQYVFDIENSSASQQSGTVRIFLAQKNNVRDRELTFEEIRMLMIELDRFTVNLHPGSNQIVRKSTESSVTIPSENIFQPEVIRQKIISKSNKDESSYCISGWPAHLLIPKGTKEGAHFLLFAMISKDEPIEHTSSNDNDGVYSKCRASSYCSFPNHKYPDKRAMGFPFDRPAALDVLSIHSYLLPNMKTADVIIKFSDK